MQAPRQPRQTTSLRTHPSSGPVIWRRPDFPSIGSIGRNTARLPASRSSSCMAGRGAGSHSSSARFFNPQRYRVVPFDQLGCGKSTPRASDDEATQALTDNTTQHLIDDVLALRHELNINSKMHVFGGSWGSTLALAYAIAHPATVQTLILRGVFLCRRADVDYFFQGNAAELVADPLAMPTPGAYLDFPSAWRHFVDVIPPEDRGDVVNGLAKAFSAPPRTDAERERLVKAASACVAWEGSASRLNHDENSHGQPKLPLCDLFSAAPDLTILVLASRQLCRALA